MRICVHRGTREIGGSCVELEHDGHALVLDVGRPLDAGPFDQVPIPDVRAFHFEDPSRVAVLLSHGHPDHYGLIPGIPEGIPLFLGEATQRILREAAFFSPAGADLNAAGYLRDREPITLGPFTVTPCLMDHSAFDSYALLIDAGGKRVLYSGDIRATGRKHRLFDQFLADPPTGIDVLLLEGTTIRAEDSTAPSISEYGVEERCVKLFRETTGIVLANYSPQNVDRIVSLHRAARRSGRTLVLDLYGAAITQATGQGTIPQGTWDSVHVFVPQNQRVLVKQSREFERVARIRDRRIYPEELAARAGELVLTFRRSMCAEIEHAGCLDSGAAIWSMWHGYLEQRSGQRFRRWFSDRDIRLTTIHASGHAGPNDLQRFATAIRAREVVPVHTLHAERFRELFENVRVRRDGEWWALR